MRLADLDYGDFYVPAFTVKVGGEDVLRDLYLAVSTVTVDLKEKAAGHFSFTVVNAFDWEARQFLATQHEDRVDLLDLFAFGAKVEIALGYGSEHVTTMLTGVLTKITTDFRSGSAPELSISGYDDLYPLTVGKDSRHWEDKPDSDAVSDLAAKAKVSTDVRTTSPVKQRIDQNNQSALSLIGKLAERNDATFYERDRTFYFGPPRRDESDVIELDWGQGLLSFTTDVDLGRQVAEVHVHGRSAATGKPILGVARRGQEAGRDTRAESGGDRVVTALSDEPVLNVRAAVRDQAEADARARAVLDARADGFVGGSGESIGLPDLVPDTNVAVGGLGPAFSKTYYLTEATHRLDRSGYRTSFKVQEPTI